MDRRETKKEKGERVGIRWDMGEGALNFVSIDGVA